MQFLPVSAWICLCLDKLLLEANFFPQSVQHLLFLLLNGKLILKLSRDVSDKAGEDGAEEHSVDAGDNAGEEDLEEDILRSTG